MRRCMLGLGVAVLACLAAGALYAAYNQAMGQIKSVDVDGGKLVVSVRAARGEEPKDVTFLIDKETTVRSGQEQKTLKDLAAEARVTVFYKEAAKGGEPGTALLISVMPQRPAGGGNRGGGGAQ